MFIEYLICFIRVTSLEVLTKQIVEIETKPSVRLCEYEVQIEMGILITSK